MKKPVRSSLQSLSISYECVLAIGNSLNLSEMLHEVIHTMVHKTSAHHGIIWVKNEEQELQPVASTGISIGDVLAQGEIMDLRDVFNQILKRQQFVLRYKDDDDFLQYCPALTEKEESVLIVPVTNVAILHLVYARSEIADEPLANLLVGLSKKLSVAIEACTAHKNIIKEMQVRVEAEEELQKKTEQQISSEKELQRLYGESEQARKSLLSILEDVTQKEDALRASEEKYRNIIENIQDIFYRGDRGGNLVMISASGAKQMGYDSVEDMLGLNIAKTFYAVPEERDGFLKVLGKTGVVNDYEITLKKKDGTLVSVRASSHLYFDKSGNPLGVEGLLSDITERKRAEQEIENLQRYNRGLIEGSLDLLVTFDHKGIILDVNRAMIQATGRTREELIGTPFADYFTDPERAYKGVMLTFEVGEVRDYELVMKARDGTETITSYNTSIYRDQTERVIGAFAGARDITERKAAEEEIKKKTEELEGFNKLAVDRELKMIELKKEINALLGKLGEEPGYEIAGES